MRLWKNHAVREMTHVRGAMPRLSLVWAPYAACAWAMVFAFVSFYWAAGGTLGVNTLGRTIQSLAHDPAFIVVVWLTGIAKVLAGIAALTLVRPWWSWIPRLLKLLGAWAGGIGLTLYGGFPFIVEGLLLAGWLRPGDDVDWNGSRWHFLLWDPWWFLGGVLFLLAAWHYQRSTAAPGA